jgi:hypothetical protein
MVGNQMVCKPTSEALIDPEPGALICVPFLAFPFQAVHVDDVAKTVNAMEHREARGVIAKCQDDVGREPENVSDRLDVE